MLNTWKERRKGKQNNKKKKSTNLNRIEIKLRKQRIFFHIFIIPMGNLPNEIVPKSLPLIGPSSSNNLSHYLFSW